MDTLEQQIEQLQARIDDYERGVQADQLLRSIAVNSPSNIMVLDLDGHIQYINHTVPGITPEEMVGLCLPEIVEEQFRSGIIGALERCAKTGETDRYETSYTSPSGDFSWWDCRVGPVLQDGKVTSFVVVSTNVTEQRRKHEEQERFFNLSVDLMCVGGFDGYFKRVNQAFITTLGYDYEELLNHPILDFVHPDDREETQLVMSRLIQGEVVKDSQNRYRAVDGSYRLFSWRGIADHKRQVLYAVARDITETKNLEEQLQQSRRLEAIGQLAGGIAHDFNNILGTIQGNIEMALSSPKLRESTLNNALKATKKAAELTRQLLVFSRHQALSPKVINVVPLIDDLMGLLERLLPENISIDFNHEDNPPYLLADKSQIEQVVVNLCVNARDAMPDGGKLTITTESVNIPTVAAQSQTSSTDEYLKLCVTDNGGGMTPEVKSRIFEPFFSTKDIGKGTGLGLATVYAIVQQHHGFLEVDSEVDRGTTFQIYLPTTKLPLNKSADASVITPTTVHGGQETILVAEDDAMVRETVTLMLSQSGYTVITANDGREAIRLYQENANKISLLLLDVVMPNLGGLDTAEQLRQRRPGLKIIFTSGHVQNQDPKRLEAETFLAKPYQRETLLACIRQMLDTNNKAQPSPPILGRE